MGYREEDDREPAECHDHPGNAADDCEECEERATCEDCGGWRLATPPKRPTLQCDCDERCELHRQYLEAECQICARDWLAVASGAEECPFHAGRPERGCSACAAEFAEDAAPTVRVIDTVAAE